MFIKAYINTTQDILQSYRGEEPLSAFLKKYFAQHKKFGSRDRKQIAHLCYCFLRMGQTLKDVDLKEKMRAGLFLCSIENNAILQSEEPAWNEKVGERLDIKLNAIKERFSFFDVEEIFSFKTHVSAQIDFEKFSESMLVQPAAHLRIRPGKEEVTMQKLSNAGIVFQNITETCVSVPPATKVDTVLKINEEVVVQDYSSQLVLNPLIEYLKESKQPTSAWDCCAASGGKSILLKDHFPYIQLTVSDIRESILANLRRRFAQAGIKKYKWFVADIASGNHASVPNFDLLLCDVPCSGSGTWGRTPEQLYFFKEEKIREYASLQKKIIRNASKALKKDGLLLYITCSVFKEENEDAVEFMQQQLSLQLISMQYFRGYERKADTLFAALFKA